MGKQFSPLTRMTPIPLAAEPVEMAAMVSIVGSSFWEDVRII
jgi:hypothetical protein